MSNINLASNTTQTTYHLRSSKSDFYMVPWFLRGIQSKLRKREKKLSNQSTLYGIMRQHMANLYM